MGNVSENFLDAAEILIDQSINKASYNRTIQAQIISCEDATIGKYKCRYQDAIIYAYSENPDVTYNEKTFVYIDIPGNDMSKDKFIRGTSKRLGINYISQAEGDQAYDIIGANCLTTNTTYYLYSICKDYKYPIYEYGKEASSNIQYDIQVLNQSIKESSSLIVGATFKTSLDPKQQYRGHYGITYNLCFFDNALNREVIRSYTVDEDNMVDNPYKLIYPTRQYEIFDIDGPNFDHIESIEIFCRDFPNAEKDEPGEEDLPDIEITNLELTGAVRMADSEINGVAISFYTPQGIFFTDSDKESTEKVITAQVRVKGKLASSAQNIPFYWGIQNVGITPDSEYYNKYLGRGWRCLNDKNVIQTAMIPIEMTDIFFINKKEENATENENISENEKQNYYYYKDISNKIYVKTTDKDNNDIYKLMTPEQYDNLINLQIFYEKNNVLEWIPSKDTYIFNKNNATARNNKLKVAIVYDGTVVTKTIIIQNLGKTVPILTIESSEGTQFYYDVGHPTLTCKVNGEQDFSCRYQWSYEDRHGFGKISTEIVPCEDEIYFEQKEEKTNLKQYETDLKNIANTLYSDQDEIKKELKNKINELEVLVERQKTIERKDNEIINELNTTIDELNKKIKEKFNEINDGDLLNQLEKNNKENYSNNLKKLYRNSFQISENLSDDSDSEELKKQFQDLMDEFENQTFVEESQQKDYIKMLAEAAQLQLDIINGEKYLNGSQKDMQDAINAIDDFKFKQRVSGNKIYDVQIRNITSFKTFKCSVYNKDGFYLGTAAITLTNKLEGQDLYSLVINNGSVTFQYDEDGIAPTSKSLQNPQQIQALSFTVYDNLGNPIDSEVIQNTKNCEIIWRIPLENTMLVDLNEDGSDRMIIPNKYVEYNRLNLLYGIANGYNIQKQNNQIELTVKYNEMNLTTRTNFTFVKQGQPGTNGTQYVVKIVPNTEMNNPPIYPMITEIKVGINTSSYKLNYQIEGEGLENALVLKESYQLFKAQLWQNGEKIWEGFSPGGAEDTQPKPTLVVWEILTNADHYNSCFEIDSKSGKIKISKKHVLEERDKDGNLLEQSFANIIKCSIKWEDKTYYGTIPITTAQVTNEKYRISLKDNTGFRYVIYTSDGVNPQYDRTYPFEFICKEKIGKFWEDISLLSEGEDRVVQYNVWRSHNARLPYLSSARLLKNQRVLRPAQRDDGSHVNVAVYCKYSIKGEEIGRIRIPIHFLLNKYGMAHINEWDGNSVQVNNNGGYILSPQMGAGTKNNNTFTGVLMGEVRTSADNKTHSDIGLLGYASGDRTFFLNSENGSAIFGKANGGQIIINPQQKHGMIYSGNFWETYNDDGLPNNYNYRSKPTQAQKEEEGFNANDPKWYIPAGNAKQNKDGKIVGAGLLIDLTTPEIYFGSGKFYVTRSGYMYASGGGSVAGWKIGNSTLTGTYTWTDDKGTSHTNTLTLDSGNSKIYSNTHSTLTNTSDGFFISNSGLSIGSKFKVSSEGKVWIGNGAVDNSGNHWTINGDSSKSYIAFGGTSIEKPIGETKDEKGNTIKNIAKVYIGTDGISLGNRFKITNQGQLTAYRGIIGGWKIGADSLQSPKTAKYTNNEGKETDRSLLTINSNGSIYGGNQKYQVTDSNGKKTGQIRNYCWSINANGGATFNYLNASKYGKIGGWTINSNSLTAGDMYIKSEGSISGSGWSINKDGVAYFSKVYGSVASGHTFTASGFSLGHNSSSLNPGTVKMAGGTGAGIGTAGTLGNGIYNACKGKFNELYADKAEFDTLKTKVANVDYAYVWKKFKYNNMDAFWNKVVDGVNLFINGNSYSLVVSERYALCAGGASSYTASSGSLPTSSSKS